MTASMPLLPVGTQVLLREAVHDADGATVPGGTLGRVVAGSTEGYRLALTDGREILAGRAALALRSARQSALATPEPDADAGHQLVRHHTVYAAVVGSRAFGLATADSDTDLRGVYAAPTSWFWSLRKPPTHVDGPQPEQFSWELERFCELALRANPNLLQLLWSPLHVTVTPLGEELLDLREAFLSQLVHQTYNGYVLSQFKRIESDLRRQGAPKWKHVMHLLRLLREGRDALRHGEIRLDAGPDRDRLLAVRAGDLPWPEVERWRLALHEEIDAALESTPLPVAPDVARIDAWLRDVRARSAREALA